MSTRQHIPVGVPEVLELFQPKADGTYVDLTCGMGGHAAAILERLEKGRLIVRDRDPEALVMARERLAPFGDRVIFDPGRFSTLRASLDRLGIARVDGILADLGMSLHQATAAHRGFSYSVDGPLDMRMDPETEITAAQILNTYSEESIAELFYRLGEEGRSRRLANAIVRRRPLESTTRLATTILGALRASPKDPAVRRCFQALRIAVNSELDEIEAFLDVIRGSVATGGRVVVISFHSIEDRLIKQGFQRMAREGWAKLINKHVITPGREEVRRNPASRSAKLRALEVIEALPGQRSGSEGKR